MDNFNWTIVQTISLLLTLLISCVGLYMTTVANPRKEQSGAIKSTEQALNEFLISYAGQYVDLRSRLDHLEEKLKLIITDVYEHEERQTKAHEDIARELQEVTFKLQLINEKLNAYVAGRSAG